MSLTFKLHMARLSNDFEELAKATGKGAAEIVRSEGKLFVQDVVRMTPPFGGAVSTESLNAQKKIGEEAVERDIRRAFALIDLDKIKSAPARERLRKLIRKNDLEGIKSVLKAMKFRVNQVVSEIDPQLHQSARDSRGRVRNGKRVWLTRAKGLSAYIRQIKTHVGRSKGGWVAAAQGLGLKLPAWITRHGTAGGSFTDQTKGTDKPKITIRNNRGSGEDSNIVERAMKNRRRNIGIKLQRALRAAKRR